MFEMQSKIACTRSAGDASGLGEATLMPLCLI